MNDTTFDATLRRFKKAFAEPDNRSERLRSAVALKDVCRCEDERAELAFTLATTAIRWCNGEPGAQKAFHRAYTDLAIFEDLCIEVQDAADGWITIGEITPDGWKPAF